MKYTTQITVDVFALFLFFSVVTTNGSADQNSHQHLIPIDPILSAWKLNGPAFMSKWKAGMAKFNPDKPMTLSAPVLNHQEMELVNTTKGSLDIFTKEKFGDCIIELEVMVAQKTNSGIYVMGRYEIQVKDSFGRIENLRNGDMGGIIDTSPPLTNPYEKPGEWQNYIIEFRAPRFENKKRISPAQFIKITLNGKIVQKNVLMEKGATKGALDNKEDSKGPLMLQGGLGAVAYRNIRISPLPSQ